MSKRFYMPSSTAADVTPAANGTWGNTASAVNRKATLYPTGTANTTGTSITWTPGQTALDRRYVTPPLSGAQTITGTISAALRIRESNADDNATPRIEAYVVSNDGSTVRGTLLAIGAYGTGTEIGTANRVMKLAHNEALSSVSAQDGDRIVFCVGYADAAGTSPSVFANYGDNQANAVDLPANTDDTGTVATGLNPWFEFSQDLVFEVETADIHLWDFDDDASRTQTGSALDSIAPIIGTNTRTFTQSTSGNKPTMGTDNGADVAEFTGGDSANRDFVIATNADTLLFHPRQGHYHVVVEFMATALPGAASTANQIDALYAQNSGGRVVAGLVPDGASNLSFVSTGFDSSLGTTVTATQTGLSTNTWYIGQAGGRGQLRTARIDQGTSQTANIGATLGVATITTQQSQIGANATASADGSFTGKIRRVAIVARHLNDAELDVFLTDYFDVSSGVSGTISVTEEADSLTASALEVFTGSLSIAEASDTLSATAIEVFVGSLASSEADDTGDLTATLVFTGSVAASEEADSGAASGALVLIGSLAADEDADSSSASGALVFIGATAVNEDDDSLSASGTSTFTIAGSISVTESNDTLAANGLVIVNVTGTITVTEEGDTLSASGLSSTLMYILYYDRKTFTLSKPGMVTVVEKRWPGSGIILPYVEAA